MNWILGLFFIVAAGGLTLATRMALRRRQKAATPPPTPRPRLESGLHQIVYLMSGRNLILTPGNKETRVLQLEGIRVGGEENAFGEDAFDHLVPFIGEVVMVEVVRRGKLFVAGHAVLEASGINLAESLLRAGLAEPTEFAPPHYHHLRPAQAAE